jgi:L-lysine 6-transaminase
MRNLLADKLVEEGSIILGSGTKSIRFRPHLNVLESDIDFGIDSFRRALKKI